MRKIKTPKYLENKNIKHYILVSTGHNLKSAQKKNPSFKQYSSKEDKLLMCAAQIQRIK